MLCLNDNSNFGQAIKSKEPFPPVSFSFQGKCGQQIIAKVIMAKIWFRRAPLGRIHPSVRKSEWQCWKALHGDGTSEEADARRGRDGLSASWHDLAYRPCFGAVRTWRSQHGLNGGDRGLAEHLGKAPGAGRTDPARLLQWLCRWDIREEHTQRDRGIPEQARPGRNRPGHRGGRSRPGRRSAGAAQEAGLAAAGDVDRHQHVVSSRCADKTRVQPVWWRDAGSRTTAKSP